MSIQNSAQTEVMLVGGSNFGRYPKISGERTINMYISDDWLVNYLGFQAVKKLAASGKGRGLFECIQGNFSIAVIGSSVFKLDDSLFITFVGNLETTVNPVSIADNLNGQICIVDGQNCWIYNYLTNSFTKNNISFGSNPIIPGFVSYHNTFFLISSASSSLNPSYWYVFQADVNDLTKIELVSQFSIETKTDKTQAVLPIPGHENHIIVLGNIVSEIWVQVGGEQNYQRVSSFNIDYGAVSPFVIDSIDQMVVWIGQNEKSSPALMVSNGTEIERISTDGIDHLLDTIKHPDQSCAFLFRTDGHIFYQFTFYNLEDNLSLVYDFNTKKFFNLVDNNYNYHPALKVISFNKKQYFVSLNTSELYETSTSLTTFGYDSDDIAVQHIIPRVRITPTIRAPGGERRVYRLFQFIVEQGVNNLPQSVQFPSNIPRMELSVSKNGNQSFSNPVSRFYNANAHYKNIVKWHNLGQANEIAYQVSFWTPNRVVCQNGFTEMCI